MVGKAEVWKLSRERQAEGSLEERVVQRLAGQIIKHSTSEYATQGNGTKSVHPSHNICVRRSLIRTKSGHEPDRVDDEAQMTGDDCMQKR